LRRLGAVVTVYAAAVLAAYAACYALQDGEGPRLLAEARGEVDRLGVAHEEMRSLRHQIADARRKLADAQTRTKRPDWSLLLAMLAGHVSEELILERCVLRPVRPAPPDGGSPARPGAAPGEPTPGGQVDRYLLELTGLARTQTAVSRFILRLEKSGLFQEVRLVKTHRRDFRDAKVVGFRVECSLSGQGGDAP
jgi:Tfp pilus assembly protein PilN